MKKQIDLKLTPEEAYQEELYLSVASKQLNINKNRFTEYQIIRKSIDARKKQIYINLKLNIYIDKKEASTEKFMPVLNNVSNQKPIIIIGAGPAGLFAALTLIEKGFKPVILERGKEVSERKRDIALLNREHHVNPESNYCFGEGGAGTFSDGKLYTRSIKRGNLKRMLQILHYFGADESVLYEAHPHIGTDKLPRIITAIRKSIEECGGEIYFNTKITDFIINNDLIEGVKAVNSEKFYADAVILATGHSARDIYKLLYQKNIMIEQKGFAMGVRVEHPQELIDTIQYHGRDRGKYLPAAYYNLSTQVDNRGVYSFCMCPGGTIVASATDENQMVVNGMSNSARNSPFANSGIVVEIKPEDVPEIDKYGALAGLQFQQNIEGMAFTNGGFKQTAPAQCLEDFVKGRISQFLPESSYYPGMAISPLHFWLPESISNRLRQGFKNFAKKMPAFLTNEAVILGVESRTSSSVRIPRSKETCEHIQIKGLYPCGEGAGFAGGIASSALDGVKCAHSIANSLK